MTHKIADPAIFELLKTISNVALVGGAATPRIYALRAPQNVEPPFIVFQEVDSDRWRHINGPSSAPAQAYFQIDAYAALPYEAKELGAAIEQALDGFRGVVNHGTNSPQDFVDIRGISYQNGSDLPDQTDEPFLFRRLAVYLVTYRQ